MIESHKRTLLRSVSYRLTAWVATVLLTWAYTGDLASSTEYSTFLHLVLTLDYYLHERAWLKVRWGMVPDQKSSL